MARVLVERGATPPEGLPTGPHLGPGPLLEGRLRAQYEAREDHAPAAPQEALVLAVDLHGARPGGEGGAAS